ncbi:acetylornithine deacetylase [Fontibacillus panacisegetis]|uniref:Acetylornithine deacetylase n=1 Tax=Fontibacillus panacisegetis TaxID=670482 RepID=A0A1G7J4X1_9BACL|nr:acetylornithine deacetylase [Fontibacillus panacisegetis]
MISKSLFTSDHVELLHELLKLDTVSPMETGRVSEIMTAQTLYANFAAERTPCKVVHHAPPHPRLLQNEAIPLSVQERAEEMGKAFWESQPSMVLLIGEQRLLEETVMFNFHMDTVEGSFPVSYEREIFVGRGAVDMKGAGVALLAGIQSALAEEPDLLDDLSILI